MSFVSQPAYQPLITHYQDVKWILENNFYSDLANILKQVEDYILWGCDDVFYKSTFNVNTCIEAICNDEELFGFSLRLGRNIQPNPECELIDCNSYLVWDWTNLNSPHPLYPQEVWDWGYPWEVSGTIYRKSDIIDFLKVVDEPKNPNYLEGDLANIFRYSRTLQKRKYLACFPLSKCLTLTVNRVQETHPNPFDTAKDTTPTKLYTYFAQGHKLNWSKFRDCNNLLIQVGSEYFELQINKMVENSLTSLPLISVICRTYNREEYIEELIVSVLAQTFTDFELLILDDGSTDNTKTVVEKYLSDTRIKYVYQQNMGTKKNGFALDKVLNRAMELTTADLICIGDSDDVFMPNKLERQVKEFESDPDIDIVFSDGYHIDTDGNILTSDFKYEESLAFNELNLPRTLFKKNIVPNPTVMIKRKAIEVMGMFETGFCPDYQFWLKSAPYLKFKYIDEKLIKYRIHENAMSTGSSSHKRVIDESINVLSDVRNRFSILDLYPEVYGCSNRHEALYSAYLDFGNTMLTANIPVPQMAIQEYQKALRHNGQAIEALNNLAVALWILEDYQNSFQVFSYLKNTFYNSEGIKHNLDLVAQLQAEMPVSNKSFILLKETTETSELLNVMEASNIILPTSKTNVMKLVDNKTLIQPLVSIIIPCYNYARFLIEAVESVINQTYQNWECLIVNDGSPDNTNEVAKHLIEIYRHKTIRLLEKQNSGVCDSRNMGVEHSSGKFLLFLDADDKIHHDFLKETVACLIETPSVGFVYTDIQYFGVKHDLISHGDFNPTRFLRSNQAPVTSLFRREIYDLVDGFKKVMETGWEDWEFWISTYEKGWQGHCLAKPYLYYRQHPSGSRLQTLHSSLSTLSLQQAKIIKLHSKLYSQKEVLWAEQILFQQNQADLKQANLASVVVPWWDHSEFLELWERNLEYLPDTEIIFIDNGSGPVGKAALEEFCSRHTIKLIRNEKNRGFAAANNQGVEIATGEYILHLNNDVEILNPPVQHLCDHAGNGIAGPGPTQNEIGEIYIEGWALCIKRSTLQALRGWCEDYGPGYWDDVDLCYQAQLAGYSLTPVPYMDKLIRHKGNATGRDGRLNQIALHIRNRGIFINKYYFVRPKIIIDSVFFQLYKTGIARVWQSLLEEWAGNGFVKHIVVLDRSGTAPKIPGIRYRPVPSYDYGRTDADREMLQQVCDEEGADLFISTYYTTPLSTPSVFVAHDMIPELVEADLNHPMWREKHHGIQHASAYITVSENTTRDLVKFFPDISLDSVTVAQNGINHKIFAPASSEDINRFKAKYGISKPYFILVGAGGGYKNTILFFKAFAQLYSRQGFEIVCTGSGSLLATELRNYTSGSVVHMLQLSDEELSTAYSGAVALVYPSKYEGFGLPVLEAIACGCPVITCPNASIPEVAGEAVLYVNDDDVDGLANALCDVQKPNIRNSLIAAGLEQAKKFSWSKMAKTVSSALIDATLLSLNLKDINLIVFPDWSQPEESLCLELEQIIRAIATHPDRSQMTLLVDTKNTNEEEAALILSSASMNLLMQEDLDVSEGPEISLVGQLGEIQWEVLLPRIQARIVLENENQEAIAQAKAETIPSCELDKYCSTISS